jgi:2-polyprenyl-3-methyl-5-hydroxy-6-metoxy-1,4-benzoquinol methylase
MITLAKACTAFGEITILQSRTNGSHAYWQGDWLQSEADRNGISLATYVHAIFGLLTQTPAQEMLMIGCGGGTLGMMLANAGRSVSIVDINSESVAFARRYFSLPTHVTCFVEDGATFMKRCQKVFDAIVIDAYMDERVPHHLCSAEFFKLLRERLAPAGCVLLNVFLQHGSDLIADVIAGRMIDAGFRARVLMSRCHSERNAIVLGGAVAGLRPPTLLMKPDVCEEEIAAELAKMHFRGGRRSWNARTVSRRVPPCRSSQPP